MSTIDITITETSRGRIAVTTPYSADFVAAAKRLGGRWAPKSKTWTFDPRDRARVEDILTQCFGWVSQPSGELATVRVVIDDGGGNVPEVRFAGRPICWRRGRDEAVRLADNVVLVAGHFPGSGGSMRRPLVISAPSDAEVTLEIRDIPVEALAAETSSRWDSLRWERVDAGGAAQRAALVAERKRLQSRLAEIDAILAAAD